ncbi:hypothetical protein Tco_1166717 [Tanacetum coccineum]
MNPHPSMEIDENGQVRNKKYAELTEQEKLQDDYDFQALNIVLQGLPPGVYALINHCKAAKDIWDRVKLLMQGTKLSYQERECKLYNEFDKFTSIKGESLHEYYLRFAQLINDMHTIGERGNYLLRFEGVTDWYQSQGYREPVIMSSATSAVTYTSVYTDSEPGRAFWGADDEEVSEGGILRIIVLGYDGLPLQPGAPPSPDYIPGPDDPQIPPVPQDEDEHEFSAEEQPLPPVDSPTAESPGYVTESDPEEDPEEYEDDETKDGPVGYPMDRGDDGDDDDGHSSRDDANDKDEDEEKEDEA